MNEKFGINLKVNKFVTIEIAKSFNKVTYYTVRFEGEKYSEFEKFVLNNKNDSRVKREFNDLMKLISKIGEEVGAKPRYFSRNEAKAEALPPGYDTFNKIEKRLYVKQHENLRLYCMRISNEVVFLFNGGIKTKGVRTAQGCRTVKKYFELANKLAEGIQEALMSREINLNGVVLDIPEDYDIMI